MMSWPRFPEVAVAVGLGVAMDTGTITAVVEEGVDTSKQVDCEVGCLPVERERLLAGTDCVAISGGG